MTDKFIGVDWGTTNFRAYLFSDGKVVDKIENSNGILNVDDFPKIIANTLDDWPDIPIVFSGMIGSSIGWIETSYQHLPLPYTKILSGACHVSEKLNREAYILGGLDYRKDESSYDVMRGEELQLLGLQPYIQQDSVAVLLGTHSKHVRLNTEEILSFQTYLTGEMFSLLQKNSIFAGPIEYCETDFLTGVHTSEKGTLLSNLFSTRSLSLLGTITHPRAFLSALLIGTELRALPISEISSIIFVGSPTLLPLYKKAFSILYNKIPLCLPTEQCNINGYKSVAGHLF
jgi:2-dehydro-3-deoxygalactonokinase